MKKFKSISMSIRILKRDTEELTPDEQKQLTDFFLALLDFDENKNVIKGDIYAKPNR